MNIVLIPCWRRAEFLQLCIEHIYEANRAKDQFYIFLIDRDFHRDVKLVAEQFKLDKHIRFTPFHNFRGNSYNVLNGYNLALNEADKYKPDLVYLIEEDIYVGKDFFDFRLLKTFFMTRTGKKEELFRCLLCEGGAQKNDADALWNAKKYTFPVR